MRVKLTYNHEGEIHTEVVTAVSPDTPLYLTDGGPLIDAHSRSQVVLGRLMQGAGSEWAFFEDEHGIFCVEHENIIELVEHN